VLLNTGRPLTTLIPESIRTAHTQHVTNFRQGADDAKHLSDYKTLMALCEDGSERPFRTANRQAA